MKFKLILFLSFTVLLTGYSQKANAQFWKRLFNKEEKIKRKAPAKPPKDNSEKQTVVKPSRKNPLGYPESSMKSRYRIDVLAPLYLNELVKEGKPAYKGRTPERAAYGLDFCEGVKLAADTLNTYDYNIDVRIHDITDAGSTIEELVRKKELESSDLIIGAFSSRYIDKVAAYAKAHNVNFVSALSPSDGDVAENPYFILLQPTFESHCEYINKMLKKKYAHKKPVILYRTSVNMDDIAYSYFVDVDGDKILCDSVGVIAELESLLDSTEDNLVLMPMLDVSYAAKLMAGLHMLYPGYKFDVIGMPSWESMKSLNKPDTLPGIAVYYTSPFYFDITTASGKAVANKYKQVTGNNLKPSELVFRGYETMFWYTYLLSRYGTIFNEKLKDNGAAPFTRYDIEPLYDEDHNFLYYENKHLYLYRYQGGSFMVESE